MTQYKTIPTDILAKFSRNRKSIIYKSTRLTRICVEGLTHCLTFLLDGTLKNPGITVTSIDNGTIDSFRDHGPSIEGALLVQALHESYGSCPVSFYANRAWGASVRRPAAKRSRRPMQIHGGRNIDLHHSLYR